MNLHVKTSAYIPHVAKNTLPTCMYTVGIFAYKHNVMFIQSCIYMNVTIGSYNSSMTSVSSLFDSYIDFILWHRHQSVITFHHLTWNGDQLELAYENTDHDGCLKM